MAAVAPLPQIHDDCQIMNIQDPSALARKRRREIIQSQRAAIVPDMSSSSSSVDLFEGIDEVSSHKKVKISRDGDVYSSEDDSIDPTMGAKGKFGSIKKPQMKYDPDVPMTKEEAAVWRREQRRKRNRESAAASRQRQRDRISELEVERDEWKNNFEEVMKKLRQHEEETGISTGPLQTIPIPFKCISMRETDKTVVSPPSSPDPSRCSSPECSPIASCSLIHTGRILELIDGQDHQVSEGEEEKHLLNKMNSRPA